MGILREVSVQSAVGIVFTRGSFVVGDDLFFVEAKMPGIGPDESAVKNSTRKLIKPARLNGSQKPGADLCCGCNVVERYFSFFPFLFKPRAKSIHQFILRQQYISEMISRFGNSRRGSIGRKVKGCSPTPLWEFFLLAFIKISCRRNNPAPRSR